MKIVWIYLIATAIFFAVDMAWLGIFAKNFYKDKLGYLMADKPNWIAAVIFYLLYIGGILFFAILPALHTENWLMALINGAVLGLLCYATYDLTNLATIAKWPVIVVIVDLAWGIFITAGVSVATYFISTKIG